MLLETEVFQSPKMMIDHLLGVVDSKNVLDKKGDVVTLRVILGGEGVKYLSEVGGKFGSAVI